MSHSTCSTIVSRLSGSDTTSFKAKTVEEFVKLISQSLQLTGNWSPYRSRGQQLRCSDFQLLVTIVANAPSFRLLDIGAEDTVAQRRQAKEEQDALAEAGAQQEENEEVITGDKQSKTYFEWLPTNKAARREQQDYFQDHCGCEKAGFKLAKHCQ